MPYEPIIPDGHHLAMSRQVDDAVTGHIFENDTNELKGHAAWRWVDDEPSTIDRTEPQREPTPEEKALAEAITALVIVGIVVGVEALGPRAKRWWVGTAAPALSTAWERVTSSRRRSSTGIETDPAQHCTASASPATGADLVLSGAKVAMSNAEWNDRYRAMLAADAFREEQARILAGSVVVDEGAALEPSGATDELPAQQFSDRIRMMLEANPSLRKPETSAELMRVFGSVLQAERRPSAREVQR